MMITQFHMFVSYQQGRAPVDSSGETAARPTDPDVVFGAERATADGGDRLQRAVSQFQG
jgi:hypothetical protein